ncbi:hypothetical protein GUJ93_ZPchr0008g11925 [Zizania palustris]|uniref:Uncharacterized protein n=1 Tax=Zizania palustris TaxID=103762 RepID=A0A8J5V4L0_ZIZPA|nr:hypothetical protein GUJ93_ZPchr0008g11925 [Zizania palustris]
MFVTGLTFSRIISTAQEIPSLEAEAVAAVDDYHSLLLYMGGERVYSRSRRRNVSALNLFDELPLGTITESCASLRV